MARGDGGKRIFTCREDHESFLHGLERVCLSHGWRVHAWVLMGNHFHLLLETPEPNLSAGMRVLLGTFSQAWNSRYQRRGHVFQGRCKAVPVAGERAEDAHDFKSVADHREEKFKDKLLGLIDKAGAKVMKRGSIAGAAVRARGEKEAERMIQAVGSKLGLPGSAEELQALRKGDPRKVICAARVKGNTSMSNDWLAKRLPMGHPAAMGQLVNRLRKDPAGLKTLKKYEKTF